MSIGSTDDARLWFRSQVPGPRRKPGRSSTVTSEKLHRPVIVTIDQIYGVISISERPYTLPYSLNAQMWEGL